MRKQPWHHFQLMTLYQSVYKLCYVIESLYYNLITGESSADQPKGIVAIGPDIDFNQPHDRATQFS